MRMGPGSVSYWSPPPPFYNEGEAQREKATCLGLHSWQEGPWDWSLTRLTCGFMLSHTVP